RYDLNVDKASVGKFGEVSIATKSKGSHQISRLEEEVFNGGIGFNFSASGILDLVEYVWRQICSNGMMGEVEHRDFTVNTVNKDRIMRLMERMDALAKNHFINDSFSDNVRRAMAVYASVYEMEQAEKMIRSHSVSENNPFNSWFIPG